MLGKYHKVILSCLFWATVLALNSFYPTNAGVKTAGPVVPFIPLIAAAVGTGGALYAQNKARQQQNDMMKKQEAAVGPSMEAGKGFLEQSKGAFGPALNYYAGMLSNPREATAPEQNRIGTLYQGQAANVRNQFARGGYGASAAESLRGQQRAANEGVIQNARPMAAGAMANMGGALGQLGFQGMGLGSGILGNVFNQGLEARRMNFNQGAALGSGLYNAYNSYLMNRATQQPGNSGGGGSSTYNPSGLYGDGSGGNQPGAPGVTIF